MTRREVAIEKMNSFLIQYERETDDDEKVFLMRHAVYWSIEADIESIWENIDWEQVRQRFEQEE